MVGVSAPGHEHEQKCCAESRQSFLESFEFCLSDTVGVNDRLIIQTGASKAQGLHFTLLTSLKKNRVSVLHFIFAIQGTRQLDVDLEHI